MLTLPGDSVKSLQLGLGPSDPLFPMEVCPALGVLSWKHRAGEPSQGDKGLGRGFEMAAMITITVNILEGMMTQ